MTDQVTDPLLDHEWLAAPAKRSRGRTALVVLLAACVCFLGGALVQKHWGSSGDAAATAGPPSMSGLQLPQGVPQQAPGAATNATDTSNGTSVVGEVVAVRDGVWIVEDLGGTRHRIAVGELTDVVRESAVGLGEVEVGDTVDISGDSVTLR